jgi:hypothetical protein
VGARAEGGRERRRQWAGSGRAGSHHLMTTLTISDPLFLRKPATKNNTYSNTLLYRIRKGLKTTFKEGCVIDLFRAPSQNSKAPRLPS